MGRTASVVSFACQVSKTVRSNGQHKTAAKNHDVTFDNLPHARMAWLHTNAVPVLVLRAFRSRHL